MAIVTLTSPENEETGVGSIIAGAAWVTGLFTIGESGEPWGIGDCSGYEVYVDGDYRSSSQGWKSGSQSASLGGFEYYSQHTWEIAIIVVTDDQGGWERIYSGSWSFTTGGPPANVRSIHLGSEGDFILAATEDGIYISSDFGDSWTKKYPDGVAETDWVKGICSSDGTYCIAVSSADAIYRSANGGGAWGAITPAGGDTFVVNKMAMSDDGQFVVIVGANATDPAKSCYTSTDYGVTWTEKG